MCDDYLKIFNDSYPNWDFSQHISEELDVNLHDDHFLPIGCKSYDEWAGEDLYELLGRD